jgi:hypothetical protein
MDRDAATNGNGKKRELSRRSNQILTAIEDLHDLETRKRHEVISTPPFHALANEVEERSREIFRMAGREEELGDEIRTDGDSIDDVAEEHGAPAR